MERVKELLTIVRPTGWLVLGIGAGAAYVAALAGWREMAVLAAACLLLLALAAAVPARTHLRRRRPAAGAGAGRGR